MAEQLRVVCDVCGDPAAATVGIRVGGRTLSKDLCTTHLSELTAGARAARRGRPRKVSLSPAPRAKPPSARRGARRATRSTAKARTGTRRRRAAPAAPAAGAA